MLGSARHAQRGECLARVVEQLAAEIGIDPGLGDGAGAAMRADLVLIGLDNGVERGRIDIAFFDQDGFQRAHPQLHFRQLGTVPVVVLVVAHSVIAAAIIGLYQPPGSASRRRAHWLPEVPARMALRHVTLDDKYDLTQSRVFVTGFQALVRLCLMQRERDRRSGLNTAGLVTGYRGSPLGGLDQQLERAQKFLDACTYPLPARHQ